MTRASRFLIGLRLPGSAQFPDTDRAARPISEGTVANPVRLLGRLLDHLGVAGLQPLDQGTVSVATRHPSQETTPRTDLRLWPAAASRRTSVRGALRGEEPPSGPSSPISRRSSNSAPTRASSAPRPRPPTGSSTRPTRSDSPGAGTTRAYGQRARPRGGKTDSVAIGRRFAALGHRCVDQGTPRGGAAAGIPIFIQVTQVRQVRARATTRPAPTLRRSGARS
jgi:hypothetical protein